MADLTFIEKAKLEKLFSMNTGYVMDFSNRSFSEFITRSVGKDICCSDYDFESNSKANRLRAFWMREPNGVVARLISDLLDYWRFTKGDAENDDLYKDCERVAERLRSLENTSRSHVISDLNNGSAQGARPERQPVSKDAFLEPRSKSGEWTSEDRGFAEMAIEEAKRSIAEDSSRPHPKVGAVVVKDGKILAVAHRGETPGCHAEYVALEEKLRDALIAGATVYTTLEPCTQRNHPKVPCAQRLIERRVKRVVVGMLDPNPIITGKGVLALREANVVTDLFASDLMAEVEELNREFWRFNKEIRPTQGSPAKSVDGLVPEDPNSTWARGQGVEADRLTLQDLLQLVPSGGAIQFLRSNNFAGFAFSWESLSDLDNFLEGRSGPDHEFIDPELEKLRRDFRGKLTRFIQHLALNTFRLKCVPGEAMLSSVPEEWEYEQPDRFTSVVKTIHENAADVCRAYDHLVRTARTRLLT